MSNAVFAFMHVCASPAVDMATLKSTEASRFTNILVEAILLRVDSSTSSCGMRLAHCRECGAYIQLLEKVTSSDEQVDSSVGQLILVEPWAE